MIKKLMLIVILLFIVGCSTYNVNEIDLVVNGIEVDSRIICKIEPYGTNCSIYLNFISNEQIVSKNYTIFSNANNNSIFVPAPRKIFVTLTEPEFDEFMKIVERCE